MLNGEGGGKIEGGGQRTDWAQTVAWDRRRQSVLPAPFVSAITDIPTDTNRQTGPCLKRNNPNLSPTVFIESTKTEAHAVFILHSFFCFLMSMRVVDYLHLFLLTQGQGDL